MSKKTAINPETAASNRTDYFSFTRHDIIRYVCDPGIQTILSVGCAEGNTEKILINKYEKTVYGLELNHDARKTAEKNGVHIIGCDANKIDPSKIDLLFDCIIFADILEHLYDPVDILKRCTALLREGGIVCISIPNFRHYSVLHGLFIKGLIHYQDSGILDRGHLRVTTRKMAIEWLKTCGLKAMTIEHIFWKRRFKVLSAVSFNMINDFIAPQIILVGKK